MANQNSDSNELIDLITKANEGNVEKMNQFHNRYYFPKYTTQKYDPIVIQFLIESSNENKPYSLLQLALIYLLGLGLEKDFDKGIELLKKSINVKCPHAYFIMAMLVLTEQTDYLMDYDALITKATDMNDSAAFVQRGVEYSVKDFKKSVKYYKKAIELKNDFAIYKLGELYHDNKKYTSAYKYYRLAIKKDIDHAYFNLAVMYRDGEKVDINYTEAHKLFNEAMRLGSIRAITSIGDLYEREGNTKKAKEYYKLAITKDDTFAKYNLGLIYKSEEKYKKTIKCFIQSAKDGHVQSQYELLYNYNVTDLDMTDEEIDDLLKFHYTFRNFGAYDGFLSR